MRVSGHSPSTLASYAVWLALALSACIPPGVPSQDAAPGVAFRRLLQFPDLSEVNAAVGRARRSVKLYRCADMSFLRPLDRSFARQCELRHSDAHR